MNFALTAREALWFLPFVAPICLWITFTDLKDMKIPNLAVLAMLVVYVVVGFFAVPETSDYLWRLVHIPVVLAVGFILFATMGVGAGDAKFAAAMAPFVLREDALSFLMLFVVVEIVALILHRIAKRIPAIRNATPDWESWKDGNLFPLGIALAGALIIYLAFGLSNGSV